MMVSDQTFLRLFPARIAGTPRMSWSMSAGADAAAVAARLRPPGGQPVQVRTMPAAQAADCPTRQPGAPPG